MNLSEYTDEELLQEIERRKEVEAAVPKVLERIDFTDLKKICEGYILDLAIKGYVDDDHAHYIFEAALEMFYGHNVWIFVNSKKG